MKFAKIVFLVASIWGVLILAPLYFMFDRISAQDPPPITHPAFYYGFVGVALTWQIAFFVISRDPIRLRPMMILAALEKFSFGIPVVVLYLQSRLHGADLLFAGVDSVLAILFLVSFFKTSPSRL
jgi:hypothetical protein